MEDIPYFLATARQFPWARIEQDGSCEHALARARLRVLGAGPAYGYWTAPGGLRAHDASNDAGYARSQAAAGASADPARFGGYAHGEALLARKWVRDLDEWGWVVRGRDGDAGAGAV